HECQSHRGLQNQQVSFVGPIYAEHAVEHVAACWESVVAELWVSAKLGNRTSRSGQRLRCVLCANEDWPTSVPTPKIRRLWEYLAAVHGMTAVPHRSIPKDPRSSSNQQKVVSSGEGQHAPNGRNGHCRAHMRQCHWGLQTRQASFAAAPSVGIGSGRPSGQGEN
ncbi:hypothetical protein AWZ03_015468, partial [Drosophila navojoa]